MVNNKYLLPKGVKSYLLPQGEEIRFFEQQARQVFHYYGYQEVVLPHIDSLSLFRRNIGEGTDIVERQIMKLEGKDNICLRPEATAQIARSYIEEGLYKSYPIFKAFYIGAMFRGEKPQRGRLREFRHVGAEFIGSDFPYADAEMIKLAEEIISLFAPSNFKLEINSLGCENDKVKLASMLKDKLKPYLSKLCPNCQRRYKSNPLRILDCKNSSCRGVVQALNIADSYLCSDCRQHFRSVLSILDEWKVKYHITHTLVRGLDYYTRTVFEFTSPLLGAQSALAAGGRYDNLISNLAGPAYPAVGFALGLERAMLLRNQPIPVFRLKAFIVCVNESLKLEALRVAGILRKAGLSCDIDFRFRSLKAQLKYSQKFHAEFVVIIGEDELKRGEVVLRHMPTSQQKNVKLEDIVTEIRGN